MIVYTYFGKALLPKLITDILYLFYTVYSIFEIPYIMEMKHQGKERFTCNMCCDYSRFPFFRKEFMITCSFYWKIYCVYASFHEKYM